MKFAAEIHRWRMHSVDFGQDDLPTMLQHFQKDSNLKDFYPNMCKALKLLTTLPVTTASAERSFSTLKCIFTLLHSQKCMAEKKEDNLEEFHGISTQTFLCQVRLGPNFVTFKKSKMNKMIPDV
uniref:HAT C-terminal dimerisation domain-containing protein n=1 Tax=Romanomermis culicivorax TaxID=13658 RepID=A0A915ID15_ROMCU